MTRTLSSQGLELLERLHDPARASYEEIARAERAVHTLVRVEITQHQFEALVSFTLEIGPANFAHSSLLKELNRGHHDLIPDELLRWTQTRDPRGERVVDAVLARRRGAEVAYWLSGTLPAATETTAVAAAAPPKHPKPSKETMEVKADKDDKDGKDSKDSSDGKSSKDGKDGSDDKGGKDGSDSPGKSGKDGSDGKSGKDGSDGGKSGKDNKDGKEGKDGSEGKEGKDGKDGKEGKDQKDGTDKGKERSDYAPEHPVIPMYLAANVSDWSRLSV